MPVERGYTDVQWAARIWFNHRLDEGDSCIRAGIKVAQRYPKLSVEFIEHLMGVENG